MDKLSNLPLPKKKVKYNDDELEVHSRLFSPSDQEENNKIKYLLGVCAALFIILSLPITDNFIDRLPYGENNIAKLVIKTAIFCLVFFVLYNVL